MEDEMNEDVFEVENIIDAKISKGQPLYRVRWKGFDEGHDTWEPRENLLTCDAILDGFLKTRCRKSVKACIDFLQNENERKAKKTKAKPTARLLAKGVEVNFDDAFVFAPVSCVGGSKDGVIETRREFDNNKSSQESLDVSGVKPKSAGTNLTEQEARGVYFDSAPGISQNNPDDEFPLTLKELTMMGGTRSETRKIVAVSEEKGSNKYVSPTRKVRKRSKSVDPVTGEPIRRPRGRPRKYKLEAPDQTQPGNVQCSNEVKVEAGSSEKLAEDREDKTVSVVDVTSDLDDDRDDFIVVSPKRKKMRVIDDDDSENMGTEIKKTDDALVENGKAEMVLSRGLFDKFSRPEILAETNADKQANKIDFHENGINLSSLQGGSALESDAPVICVGESVTPDSKVPTTISLPSIVTLNTEPAEHTKNNINNVAGDEKIGHSSQTVQENHDIGNSQPAGEDDLEFDFDDFSPDDECDLEITDKKSGNDTTGEFIPFVQLKQAVRDGDVDVVRRAVDAKCDLDQADGINGMTLLMWAAMEGQVEVAALLSREVDVNARQRNGSTSLMVAAEQGFENICEILISAGAHLNVAQQTGETALMKAAKKGHLGTVSLLLRKGADFRAESSFDHSAWSYAQRNHHLDVQTLITHHTTRVTKIFEAKAGEIASREDEALVMPAILSPTLRIPSEQQKLNFAFSLTPAHKLDGCQVNLFVLTVQLDAQGSITMGELPAVTQYNFSCHFSGGRVSWKNASVCQLPSLSSQNKLEFLAAGFKSHEDVLAVGVYIVKKAGIPITH